jgi:hypothetical protein
MKLSPSAMESPTRADLQLAARPERPANLTAVPVGGRAQGIALNFGKGKVVVVGEAAMFTAQIARFNDGGGQREVKMGMNVSGNDDQQFALNVVRWLSGALK